MSDPGRRRDAVFFVFLLLVVIAAKFPVLDTPCYWDETMWSGFAATLAHRPLWEVLPGLHPPTLYGGRPPGLFLVGAVLFKAFGFSIRVAHLLILGFSFLGAYFTYLLASLLYGRTVGVFASFFLFFNAIYFAQSAMFLADLPVAALGVASVYYAQRERYGPYLLGASLLVLLKETAMAIVFSIAVYVFVLECRRSMSAALAKSARYVVPLLVIAGYYTYKKIVTGTFFVDSAFPFEPFPLRLGDAIDQFWLVTRWLFVMQYRWVFSLLIVLNLVINRASRRRHELLLFSLIFLCSGYSFCVLYFLPRYLLPVAPYLFILAAWSLAELVRDPAVRAAAAAGLIALQILVLRGGDRFGNREWSMDYLDVVRTNQAMCAYIEREFPGARVLTIWPFLRYLGQPAFGYVQRPVDVVAFDSNAAAPGRGALVLNGTPASGERRALADYIRQHELSLIVQIEAEETACELYEEKG